MSRGANAYRRAHVESAPPTRLLEEMFTYLENDLRTAAECITTRDIHGKARACDRALAILSDLEAALDHNAAPELCQNLARLYRFSSDRILEASIRLDTKPIAEVQQVLAPIIDAFRVAMAQSGSSQP